MKLKISEEVSLPVDVVTERISFIGQSGSGKTYAAMRLAELMLEAGAQIIALDPMGVWWGLLSAANGKASGYPVHVFGGEHAHVPIVPGAGAIVADVVVEKQVSAVIDVSHFTKSEQSQFCIAFAERLFKLQVQVKRPVHLFLEEAQTFMPQNLPRGDAGGDPKKNPAVMLNRMELLVRQGRSQGIGCSMITQAPQAVAKSCLNQAGTLFAMRTMGKHERKAVGDWMADKATDDSQLKLDQLLPKLNTGEAWIASPNFLGVYQQVHITKKTTFDSSATPKFGVKLEAPKVLADVDVAALRASMDTVVKQAEVDDPKALKREIATLKAELAKKPAAAPTKPLPPVEVPILTAKDRAAMVKLVAVLDALPDRLAPMRITAVDLRETLKQSLSALVDVPKTLVTRRIVLPPVQWKPATAGPVSRTPSGENIGKGERAVLTAIAQHGAAGVTREQLTVLTGYKKSSRDTYLQKLTAGGLVSSIGDQIGATEDGLAALGKDFEPLPTGEALRAHWLQRLPEGERRILDMVTAVYPKPVAREDISELTGYKKSSRDTYLQKLAARKLILASRGEVVASETLFEVRA